MTDACCPDDFIGADPAIIKWKAVRGDTASLMVQFLQADEVNYYDTTGWTYAATAHSSKTDTDYDLDIQVNSGYIKVTATPDVTATWGAGQKTAELSFDVQVTTADETVWTPIIGTIFVIGDVTGA